MVQREGDAVPRADPRADPGCAGRLADHAGEVLMPALCSTDEVMFRLQRGKLYREHTIASGDPVCDYWITGDKMKETNG